MKTRLSTIALSVLALSAPLASAAITGVTGSTTWLLVAPPNCGPGALTGFNAFAWNEQQNISLATINCDMVNNPGTSTGAIPGSLAGVFDSQFIHFQNQPGAISASGSVSFSGPIVGVIFYPLNLDNSDASCGAPGTLYPTGYPFRGIGTSIPSFCSISANTLTFNLNTFASVPEVAQIRVLTQPTPAPGSATLLGLAGLACARRRR